ncbi:MAG: BT4734/BF3469 family protein [Mariniphaga sp.]
MNKDSQFSYFSPPVNKRNPVPSCSRLIGEVYQEIKGNSLKLITDKIRLSGTKEERTKIKQSKLPYVTFAGTFTYRSSKDLISRSGYIVIDIDHIAGKVEEIKTAILSEITPVLMFTSPSGDGLKIVCCIDTTIPHNVYFSALKSFFHQHFSVTIDKGNDIARACFLCHDADVFMSDNPTNFDQAFIDGIGTNDFEEIYRRGKIATERKFNFADGSRHNFIMYFAGFLNRAGMDQVQSEMKLVEYQTTGFDAKEISDIVTGVFKNTLLHGIAPMNIAHGRELYTTFPLKLLHVPREKFINQINVILSDSYEHTKGDIPTSVKTQYLIEVTAGTFDPEMLLLIAAVKSKMLYGNYTRTTYAELMKRMYGGRPWRNITRRFYDRLMNEAIKRNMLVKIKSWKSFYISIRYTADQLADAIIAKRKKDNEPKKKIKDAAKRISDYRKSVQ